MINMMLIIKIINVFILQFFDLLSCNGFNRYFVFIYIVSLSFFIFFEL